ncbi:hypothetical protein [Aeromonas salmonicida]|uniref:hypothetical protein n=1 Tax=Aeromonas salmonicida TaxID=645 RepID=UPI000A8DC2E6|nr:hypothetical protein [Aeromonas salmonicida]
MKQKTILLSALLFGVSAFAAHAVEQSNPKQHSEQKADDKKQSKQGFSCSRRCCPNQPANHDFPSPK